MFKKTDYNPKFRMPGQISPHPEIYQVI